MPEPREVCGQLQTRMCRTYSVLFGQTSKLREILKINCKKISNFSGQKVSHLQMKPQITCAAITLICGIANAQASVPAPPLHPSATKLGIHWTSRSNHYEGDFPPIFLAEKAFEIKTPVNGIKGRFVMLSQSGGDGKGHNLNVWGLRELTVDDNQQVQTDATFYNSETNNDYYAPLFSPNGQNVFFRYGLPPDDNYNAFGIGIWNLKDGSMDELHIHTAAQIKAAPDGILPNVAYFNPNVSWSPGSRYISYLRGGNSVGGYFDRMGAPYSDNGYELWTTDARSNGYAHRIAVNVGLAWSWTNHGTLLWNRVTAGGNEALRQRTGRPVVYESGASGGAPTKLFEGGYFMRESPDGQWIAFVDWPGFILGQDDPTPAQQAENAAVVPGVYLFNRATGQRVLAGAFPAAPPLAVQLQWTPDGQHLFVFNTQEKTGALESGLEGALYRMDIDQQQLQRVGTLPVERPFRTINTTTDSWFLFRGTSPDGSRIYANTTNLIDGPPRYVNDRHTMWSIEAGTGVFSAMATLTDIANENPGWDFHDDSGVNPASAAAEKLENTPVVRAPRARR